MLRKGVATDNEEGQKKTKHLRERLIEQDDNRRDLGEANKILTDPGKVAEKECVSARALPCCCNQSSYIRASSTEQNNLTHWIYRIDKVYCTSSNTGNTKCLWPHMPDINFSSIHRSLSAYIHPSWLNLKRHLLSVLALSAHLFDEGISR